MAVRKIRRRGRQVWRARVIINGKTRIAYRDRKDDAVECEARFRKELRGGAGPPRGKAPTLSAMWPEFVAFQVSSANKRPWRPRTRSEAERIFKKHIGPVLGGVRVDRIAARDVDQMVAKLEDGRVTKRKLKPNTVANATSMLRRMLRVAKRWGYLTEIPEIESRKVAADKLDDDRWLTPDETEQLLEAAEPRWRSILIVAVRCGLRLGELRALQWADVDLPQRRLHIRRSFDDRTNVFGAPKGGTSRLVPLTHDAVETLGAMARGGPRALVFGEADGRPFHRNSLVRALDRATKRAELAKHVHPHMTRHTWASHCISQGIPTRVVMRWGGWTSEAMLARYGHLSPESVDHFIDRIALGGLEREAQARRQAAHDDLIAEASAWARVWQLRGWISAAEPSRGPAWTAWANAIADDLDPLHE